ncbi:MAG: response regulator [Polyangiales bacterium]
MSTKVLLVDDDDGARLTLQALLEDEGFSVTEAASSNEALALAGTIQWDLVLLDQHIGPVLGSDLVPTLRKTAPTAKIVIVSGSAEDVVTAGDGFFPKGGAFDALLVLLRSLR